MSEKLSLDGPITSQQISHKDLKKKKRRKKEGGNNKRNNRRKTFQLRDIFLD